MFARSRRKARIIADGHGQKLASLVWHIDPGYGAPMTLLATFLWLWPGTSDIMARPDQATKYVWVVGHLYYLVAIIVVSPLGFIPWFFPSLSFHGLLVSVD
ncbi:hypothetical protein JMJ77_0008170 [Colletotrichum scovillei]|uniref:Uncharacterized protein n=1 Tax=Colletotrichum scovillei TaxID=1209932 RepID=A0A9P7UG72_9PEZI|nr:hypothetical protein JMJ77_0008170 [Colletotrichum scovillei]KAG7075162.1 hypothetical protein JMJ76_0011624 [Colletotrichum scovillei]KAG7082132.1 hypothetical protein JMJ78_0004237 [Colletotrichum scovillei]